jgi:UDP-2,3-diacylglucosamine hydrolase
LRETLFISDVHLSLEQPEIVELFQCFLQQQAVHAEAVYILGDLFDAWIGDDDDMEPIPTVIAALRALSDSGVKLFIQRGNRDFLIGHRFALATGCQLLNDPAIIELYGTPTLLMHGDLLCTDDTAYQKFRHMIRHPLVKNLFLLCSLKWRRSQAMIYRLRSREIVAQKTATVMDVNQATVERYMQKFKVKQLIHGHTHLPAQHQFYVDNKLMKRFVLGAWNTTQAIIVKSWYIKDYSRSELVESRIINELQFDKLTTSTQLLDVRYHVFDCSF